METDRQTDITRHHGRASSPEPRPSTRCGLEQWEHRTHQSVRTGMENKGVPCTPQSHQQMLTSSCHQSPSVLGPAGAGTHEVTASCLSAVWPQPPLSPPVLLLTGTLPFVLGCLSPHSPSVGSAGSGGSGGGGSGGGAPLSSAAVSFSPATERHAGPKSPQYQPGVFGGFGVSLLPCRHFFLSTSCLYSSSSWSVSWLKGFGGSASGGASSWPSLASASPKWLSVD